MSGTRRNGILACVVVEMISMLAIQGNYLVSSSTAEACNPGTELNRSLTSYTCEESVLNITCKENKSLHIEYVNFGDRTREICKFIDKSLVTNCSLKNSLSIVRDLCSRKLSCNVKVTNRNFNDQCRSTYKYLGVIHHCYPVLPRGIQLSRQNGSRKRNYSRSSDRQARRHGSRIVSSSVARRDRPSHTVEVKALLSMTETTYGRTTEVSTTVTARTSNLTPTTNATSTSSTRTAFAKISGTLITPQVTQRTVRFSPTNIPLTATIRARNLTGNMTTSDNDLITSSMNSESSTYNGPKCRTERKRNVNWTDTPANSIATALCPNNRNLNNAKRTCGSQVKWNSFPDLSECVSEEMLRLQRKLKNLTINFSLDGVHELMDGLANVSENRDLYGGDLLLLAKVMFEAIALTERNNLTNVTNTDAHRINEMVLSTTSNLLQQKDTWMDLPRINQSSTATRLLCSVESSSALLASSIDEVRKVTRHAPGLDVLVDVMAVAKMELSPAASFSMNEQTDSAMLRFHPEAENGLARVTFALFDGIAQWLHVNDSATESPFDTTTPLADLNSSVDETDSWSEATPKTFVNTKVIAISIVSRSEKDAGLQKRVRYTLEHKEKNSSNPVCVFWKYSKETFDGHWSDEGCWSVSSNSTHTICECDHLTNFAVLMSVSGHEMSDEHAFALSLITRIGCIISIICLALAFITFCWFKGLQCDRNTIHKNLVLCLFISEVIFLLGIAQHEHKVLCAVVAGFLHYFFLASFSWMCLEGVQIYVLFIEVFEAEKSRLRWYYPSAYGVPALIVIISAAVTRAQGNSYAAEEYCWLTKDNGLIWAFVGPVAAIIAVNSVMLGVAIHTMCKHTLTASSWKMKSRIDTIGSWVRGAVLLMILLGSTWTFGFLYINKHSLFMAYIFTILNSLQGLFIFIFHCLINEKVQKEYRRCIQRRTWLPEDIRVKYGGLSGSAALSTTPNQSNSSGVPTLKNRKRDNSLSSSSFQMSSNDATRKKGSSSSSAFSHKVKRHASSTSESSRLTDSSRIPSSDYLYDHDETMETPSGSLDTVMTQVDENEFNGQDMVEISAMEESFIITDRREHRRFNEEQSQG